MKQKTTTSHDEIKAWVEEHHGRPSIIGDIRLNPESLGVRIDFPGKLDEQLLPESKPIEDVSWDIFFKVFENKNLAFISYDKFNPNDPLSSFKFINRDLINEMEAPASPFDPNAFTEAIKGPVPEFATHSGKGGNPKQGEVMPAITDDEIGEGDLGGDNTDLEADDDTTQAAADLGLLDPEEKKDQ